MPSANAATIRSLYERLMGAGCMEDAASVEIVPRFFDADVEICQMANILGTAGQFHGHRGVVESTLEVVRGFADRRSSPKRFASKAIASRRRSCFAGRAESAACQ
jgi:hypothetical protein